MTREELKWAAKTIQLARELRPNADVHLLLRDFTPDGIKLDFDETRAVILLAQLPSVGGDSHD